MNSDSFQFLSGITVVWFRTVLFVSRSPLVIIFCMQCVAVSRVLHLQQQHCRLQRKGTDRNPHQPARNHYWDVSHTNKAERWLRTLYVCARVLHLLSMQRCISCSFTGLLAFLFSVPLLLFRCSEIKPQICEMGNGIWSCSSENTDQMKDQPEGRGAPHLCPNGRTEEKWQKWGVLHYWWKTISPWPENIPKINITFTRAIMRYGIKG